MLSQKHSLCVVDMTVLERQQERIKWLQQQQHSFVNQNNNGVVSCPMDQFQGFIDQGAVNADMIGWKKRPEMCLISNELPKYGHLFMDGTEFGGDKMEFARNDDRCLSRSSSCQVGVLEAAKMEEEMVEVEVERTQFNHGRGDSSKRKAEFVPSEECKDKKNKGELESVSKVAEKSNTEMSVDSSKENGKTSECQKPDFIHVRARRGQATDSHSLAERARREKISKKMKNLQDLVPGCNKITGRAGMLDEIINYVQSLQRQVEFLSMKLAAVSPGPEINIENFFGKEFPAYVASFPTATMSSAMANLTHLHLNLVLQQTSVSEPEVLANPPQTSSSGFIPELCLDSSCFPQVQAFWDGDSQNLHNAGYHQN